MEREKDNMGDRLEGGSDDGDNLSMGQRRGDVHGCCLFHGTSPVTAVECLGLRDALFEAKHLIRLTNLYKSLGEVTLLFPNSE